MNMNETITYRIPMQITTRKPTHKVKRMIYITQESDDLLKEMVAVKKDNNEPATYSGVIEKALAEYFKLIIKINLPKSESI